jgi:hypothetical protein
MNRSQRQRLISKENRLTDIYINPEGKIYITKADRDVLRMMSTLNLKDKKLKKIADSNNICPFCG